MAKAARKHDGNEAMDKERASTPRPKPPGQKAAAKAVTTHKVAVAKPVQRKRSFDVPKGSKALSRLAASKTKAAVKVTRSQPVSRTRSDPELRTILDRVSLLVRERGATHALAAIERIIVGGTADDPGPKPISDQQEVYEAEAKRWKELRAEFLNRYRSVTAPELAEITGSKSKNPSSRAHEWLRAGKIFAVNDGTVARYPLFQLDPTEGKPRPEIQKVLAYLRERLSDWQIAIWFTTPNTMAGNWRRPIELLGSEVDQVVKAAEFEVAETVL